MVEFDRSHATYFLLVHHCKYSYLVPFSSYLTLKNIVTLKSRLGVTQDD